MELLEGIVLKTIDYQENSKIIYILTPVGIKSAIVRAAKSLKSHTFSYAQPLVRFEFELKKSNYIGSFKILDNYNNIKLDLDKLKYALSILEIGYNLGEHINDYGLFFTFTKEILSLINDSTNKNYDVYELIFKIKTLYLLGVAPVFNKCVTCGSHENLDYFSFNDGGMKCKNCLKQDDFLYPIATIKEIRVLYLIKLKDLIPLINNQEIVYDYHKINHFLSLYYEEYLGFTSSVNRILK